jgi:hypothetical protein
MRGNTKALVMPGLDPGIHPSSQEAFFSKEMDCRVKPGNDLLAYIRATHNDGVKPFDN